MYGYIVSLIIMGAIFAIAAMGVNLQWGYTGLFNIGIAGWFAAGAYTSAILTTPPATGRVGGFGLPFPVGVVAAALVAGILAYFIGACTLHLRFGFFAIATLGFGRIIVLIIKNEPWLTNGLFGIGLIPRPLSHLSPVQQDVVYGIIVVGLMLFLYFLLEWTVRSPWGRLQMAIKEDEFLTEMLGKDVYYYRMESLIIGSMLVGIAGAAFAHYQQYINPRSFGDVMGTFIIWVMVVAGGTGNNKGSIAGAFVIWLVWTLSEFGAGYLPLSPSQIPYVRTLMVGLVIIGLLRWRPRGLIGRERAISAMARTELRSR